MNILFYYTSNKRTISIESVIIAFRNQGHCVTLLTQSGKEELHEELEKNNIPTHTHVVEKSNSIFYYMNHLLYLIKYCKLNEIDIVYSHLQQANIVSVFAQFFCKSKFYICRHHSSVNGAEKNFNQSLFDKIINKFSKLIIVPSLAVYRQVNEVEGVNKNKIKLIHYGYNFLKYPLPNKDEGEKIRNTFPCKLLLVKVARLVSGKRYEILFDVLKELVIKRKLDIKLIVISEGPLFNDLQNYVKVSKLDNNIFLVGNKSNVIDYLYSADAIPLLSEAEASNSVIKEAGLVKKCVLICKNVGDFDDYITDGVSGLFMDRLDPASDLEEHLVNLYNQKIDKQKLGMNLYESVMNKFSIDKVITDYNVLNQ